ncbi:MAG TPA: response regulator [Gaiellaceae bacterium]|nr:response regulator [Gaiellaceae bacterium]
MLRRVRLRCLIVDDNESFLEIAAASLAGEDLDVLGSATTSAEALRQVAEQRPDVVLVDVNLGEESGFDLARRLVQRFPQLASGVVLISTRAERDFGGLIEASPAAGFVPKTRLSAEAVRELVASRSPSDREGT